MVREQFTRKYLGWLPLIVIGLLAVFYLIRGPMKFSGGRSGKTLPRFSPSARFAHWFMAGVFITLGLTGKIILLGRPLIAPYLGKDTNAVLAGVALQIHNLFGPVFIFALLWLFIKFVRGNFFHILDIKWIMKFGGFFGGHVSSRQFNFGEKSWFWMVILGGIMISVTGLIMLFPGFVDDIRLLQISTILHAVGAMVLIAVALAMPILALLAWKGRWSRWSKVRLTRIGPRSTMTFGMRK